MKQLCCYICGAMEFRTYEELLYEHFYVRTKLAGLGVTKIVDPLQKEDHKPGKKVTLTKCGIDPHKVYEIDMKAVEEADIVFWITGDKISEGSVTETAVAGAWNRWGKKPLKTIVIVSPLRATNKLVHFSNFHKGVKIVKDVQDGLAYIKRQFKL